MSRTARQGRCTAVTIAHREKHRGLRQAFGLGSVRTLFFSIMKRLTRKMLIMKMGTAKHGMRTGVTERYISIITVTTMAADV